MSTAGRICAVIVIVAGMVGLYEHVQYSGWVLAAGILVFL